MRPIDADALYREVKTECNPYGKPTIGFDDGKKVLELIDAAPTIEPEVRHGRWILCEDQRGVDNDNNNYAYFCSQCHYQDVHSKYAKVNFCWNCGCKMQDGGADNDSE